MIHIRQAFEARKRNTIGHIDEEAASGFGRKIGRAIRTLKVEFARSTAIIVQSVKMLLARQPAFFSSFGVGSP
jgi:hypothetical protein